MCLSRLISGHFELQTCFTAIHRILGCSVKIRFASPPPPLRPSVEIGGRRRCCRARGFFRRNRISKGPRCFPLPESSSPLPFIDSGEASAALSPLSLPPSRSLVPWVRSARTGARVYNGLTGYRRGPRIKRAAAKRFTDQTRVTNTTCIFSTRSTRIISTCRSALDLPISS